MKGRTKIESLTSKNSKYTKQFNREFEKKMYWNGTNSYMISGVKAQYDKLKEGKSPIMQNTKKSNNNAMLSKDNYWNHELLNSRYMLKHCRKRIRNWQKELAK